MFKLGNEQRRRVMKEISLIEGAIMGLERNQYQESTIMASAKTVSCIKESHGTDLLL